MNKNIINLIVGISIIWTGILYSYGQNNKLYDLGKKLINITSTEKADQLFDVVDPNLDLDKKAEILESFLKTKEFITNTTDIKNLKLFNVLEQNDKEIWIIVTDGKKFYIVKNKINDQGLIIDKFNIIHNELANAISKGSKVYKVRCLSCHGKFGKGSIGPNLTDPYWKYVNSDADMEELIAKGKKGTMMIAYKDYLSPEEIKNVSLYIKALQGKETKNPKKNEGEQKKIKFTFK